MSSVVRIKKPLARKMFYNGITITVVPCKCSVDNTVAKSVISLFDEGVEPTNRFDRFVRDFENYNCGVETGYYASYYVSEKDMESYNMCNMMCN